MKKFVNYNQKKFDGQVAKVDETQLISLYYEWLAETGQSMEITPEEIIGKAKASLDRVGDTHFLIRMRKQKREDYLKAEEFIKAAKLKPVTDKSSYMPVDRLATYFSRFMKKFHGRFPVTQEWAAMFNTLNKIFSRYEDKGYFVTIDKGD